jgi:hypothetical protein
MNIETNSASMNRGTGGHDPTVGQFSIQDDLDHGSHQREGDDKEHCAKGGIVNVKRDRGLSSLTASLTSSPDTNVLRNTEDRAGNKGEHGMPSSSPSTSSMLENNTAKVFPLSSRKRNRAPPAIRTDTGKSTATATGIETDNRSATVTAIATGPSATTSGTTTATQQYMNDCAGRTNGRVFFPKKR